MPFRIAPHLAFLVQWLRVLGVDVRLWDKETAFGEQEVVVIQWAPYPLPLKDKGTKTITLSSSTPPDLLNEFFQQAGFQPEPSDRFTRCLRCNSPLMALSAEEATHKWPDLPVYVFQTQNHFNWCKRCRQLFWAGTHVRNMIGTLEDWGVIPKNGCGSFHPKIRISR